MKDFHDLYSIILSESLSSLENLASIISLVFKHRETKFSIPIVFSESELLQLQNFWNKYLRSLRQEHASFLPAEIANVITKINESLTSNTLLL